LAVLRPQEGGLRRGEIFWLHLQPARSVCVSLSAFYHYNCDSTAIRPPFDSIRLQFDHAKTILRYGLPVLGCLHCGLNK